MNSAAHVPLPRLTRACFGSLCVYTDEALMSATGLRIAFTERTGGLSKGAFESLNLGQHTEDDASLIAQNRRVLTDVFSTGGFPILSPHQVHGQELVVIDKSSDAWVASQAPPIGDAVVVGCAGVGALLCFADCIPLIIVSPTGRFAVVHVGWRGVLNSIALRSLRQLMDGDASQGEEVASFDYNVYVGPYIHRECFEVSSDLSQRFAGYFGSEFLVHPGFIDLGAALKNSLLSAGIDESRIADVDICTACNTDRFFSHRASGGKCGRHGALAVRV